MAIRILASLVFGLPASVSNELQRGLARLHRFPLLSSLRFTDGSDTLQGSNTLATKSTSSIALNVADLMSGALDGFARDWDGMLADPSIYGVVIHEGGHVMNDHLMRKLGARKYNVFLEKHFVTPHSISSEHTTPYGQENVYEAMAEAFVMYLRGRGLDGSAFAKSQLRTATAIWDEALTILKQPH